MNGFNKVVLIGNLTRDPELIELPSGTPAVNTGLAMNRKWRDREGNLREDVCFVNLRAYARAAETLNRYVRKGSPLLVDGRLQHRSWETEDGARRSAVEVVVEKFQFLPDGKNRVSDENEEDI